MVQMAPEVRRAQLVEAAIAVMVRDGVSAATTRAIVAEAGMPLGAFHYCFASKRDLLGEVVETLTGYTLELALSQFVSFGTLEERLRRGADAYWQHVVDFPAEHRLTYELGQYAARRPDLADVASRQYQNYLDVLAQLLHELKDDTGTAIRWRVPLPTLARYITGILDGVTLLFLNEGDAAAARETLMLAVDHVAELALDG